MAMIYKTKKEVLERLGKNPSDNKLVDRMISRWEVIMEDGYYIIMKEYIENLQRKVKELEKENADLKERSVSVIQANSVLEDDDREEYLKEINDLEKELAESQIKQEQLGQRNAYLEEKMNWAGDGEDNKSSSNELEEAKIQREYYENKANKYKEAINKVIEVTYSRIKPALWSRIGTLAEFRVNILEEVSDLIRD